MATTDTTVRQGHKGIPVSTAIAGASLRADEVSLPAMALRASAIDHNLAWMQRFIDRHGLQLAPHGKTTMTPALFRRQIEAGAWGITLATATQCEAAHADGVRRMLMANQLIGAANMARISALLDDASVDFYCTVDSTENVHALGSFFAAHDQTLRVLIEIGVPGGRCGCRNRDEALALADAIAAEPALLLAGIEGYEGVIHGDDAADGIRAYARELIATADAFAAEGRFGVDKPIISASGSAWYDIIAEAFSGTADRYTPLLRPGCYLSHDHGLYLRAQADIRARHADFDEGLRPALEVWACVQSLPEPGCAVVALGKRDIAFDADMPAPLRRYRPTNDDAELPVADYEITGMMDQHAFMQIPTDTDLRVGDIIAFGASHPCLTFDKWRQICLVDDDDCVIELLQTAF